MSKKKKCERCDNLRTVLYSLYNNKTGGYDRVCMPCAKKQMKGCGKYQGLCPYYCGEKTGIDIMGDEYISYCDSCNKVEMIPYWL